MKGNKILKMYSQHNTIKYRIAYNNVALNLTKQRIMDASFVVFLYFIYLWHNMAPPKLICVIY